MATTLERRSNGQGFVPDTSLPMAVQDDPTLKRENCTRLKSIGVLLEATRLLTEESNDSRQPCPVRGACAIVRLISDLAHL